MGIWKSDFMKISSDFDHVFHMNKFHDSISAGQEMLPYIPEGCKHDARIVFWLLKQPSHTTHYYVCIFNAIHSVMLFIYIYDLFTNSHPHV